MGSTTSTASVQAVAEACNLDPRRIQQLAAEGVLPRSARGAYDVDACLRAYVRYLQDAMAARATVMPDGEVVTTKGTYAELTRVQTELKQLELAQRRGSVMAIEDHEAVLSTLIIETKARVMAIAPRVAPKVLGQTSRLMVQATIEAEAKIALTDLAKRTPMLPRGAGEVVDVPPEPAPKAKRPQRTKAATKPKAKKPAAKQTAP